MSCILEINSTLIDNLDDVDIGLPMYKLIEYNKEYSKTTGTL